MDDISDIPPREPNFLLSFFEALRRTKAYFPPVSWAATSAIANLALAAVAIWIPFSDIPKHLEEISALSKENRALYDKNQTQQTQINESVLRALESQGKSTSALLRMRDLDNVIQQREAQLQELNKDVLNYETRVSDLSDRIQKFRNSYERGKTALNNLIDDYAHHILTKTFLDAFPPHKLSAEIHFPVSAHHASPSRPTIQIISLTRKSPFFPRNPKNDNGTEIFFESGDFYVGGVEVSFESKNSPSDISMNYKILNSNHPEMIKIKTLLASQIYIRDQDISWVLLQVALNPQHGDFRSGLRAVGPNEKVVDIVSKMYWGTEHISFIFVNGEEYENHLFSEFWNYGLARHFGEWFARKETAAINDHLTSQMRAGSPLYGQMLITSEQQTMSRSRIASLFGEEGIDHFSQVTSNLNKAWIDHLRESGNKLLAMPPDNRKEFSLIQFNSDGKIEPIYPRWDWDMEVNDMSRTLFETLPIDWRMKFILRCEASKFLTKNKMSSHPVVVSSVQACPISENGITSQGTASGLSTFLPLGQK